MEKNTQNNHRLVQPARFLGHAALVLSVITSALMYTEQLDGDTLGIGKDFVRNFGIVLLVVTVLFLAFLVIMYQGKKHALSGNNLQLFAAFACVCVSIIYSWVGTDNRDLYFSAIFLALAVFGTATGAVALDSFFNPKTMSKHSSGEQSGKTTKTLFGDAFNDPVAEKN